MSDPCPVGKIVYATERHAKRAARVYNRGKPGHPRQVRKQLKPYPCPLCKAWHLTSQRSHPRRSKP